VSAGDRSRNAAPFASRSAQILPGPATRRGPAARSRSAGDRVTRPDHPQPGRSRCSRPAVPRASLQSEGGAQADRPCQQAPNTTVTPASSPVASSHRSPAPARRQVVLDRRMPVHGVLGHGAPPITSSTAARNRAHAERCSPSAARPALEVIGVKTRPGSPHCPWR
jgi:hypothetical protein